MKVRAIQSAFYDGRRVRPGDELEVPDTLTASWFGPAPAEPAKPTRRAKPIALSQLGKEAPAGPLDKSVDALV